MKKNLKQRIFYDSPLNSGRQCEFDIARAILIFCLALIHLTIECSTPEALSGGIPYILDSIIGGSFSAPMYMFVMGVGMFYVKRSTFKDHAVRGIKIFLIGYILNIFRFLIPSLIGYKISGDEEKYITPLVYKFFGNDILTFAGLAMIIIAFFIKINMPKWLMLAVAFGASALGTLLNGIDVKSVYGNIFLGYLIGTEDAAGLVLSDFPILNWLIFPLCGYVFASVLITVKDKKLFYALISPVCVIFTIIYFVYGIKNEIGMFGEGQNCYYHMLTRDAFASLTLIIGLVGIYYYLSLVLPEFLLNLAKKVSKGITSVYCIHWPIVFVFADVILYITRGTQILETWQILVAGTVISIVSIVIADYYDKFKKKRKQKGLNQPQNAKV